MIDTFVIKIVAGLALAGAVAFGVHSYNQHLVDKGFAEAEAKYKPRAERAEKALDQSEKERVRYEKQVNELAGVAQGARVQLDAVRTANAGLVRAGDRLRQQLAALRRTAPGAEATPAGGGQAADSTGDLFADVQRRLDEATDATVRFADEGRIAGLACQRAYEVKP